VELNQLRCCGVFELDDVGEWDPGELYNPDTGEYECPTRTCKQSVAACKKAIREELSGIEPRGRMVLATTVPDMGVAMAALRALRFKPLKRFRNGNTGNRVTLWGKYVR